MLCWSHASYIKVKAFDYFGRASKFVKIFVKISRNFIESPLKICFISQISVHGLCMACITIFQVPLGDKNRLNRLPSLCGQEFSITNKTNFKKATADIQLSSLGKFVHFSWSNFDYHYDPKFTVRQLHVHTMQGDTCPTEWYISNGHSANSRELDKFCLVESCFLDTRSSEGTVEGHCPLVFQCAMYLPSLGLISRNQLSTNQNLSNACANSRNDRWICIIPLDMYHLA